MCVCAVSSRLFFFFSFFGSVFILVLNFLQVRLRQGYLHDLLVSAFRPCSGGRPSASTSRWPPPDLLHLRKAPGAQRNDSFFPSPSFPALECHACEKMCRDLHIYHLCSTSTHTPVIYSKSSASAAAVEAFVQGHMQMEIIPLFPFFLASKTLVHGALWKKTKKRKCSVGILRTHTLFGRNTRESKIQTWLVASSPKKRPWGIHAQKNC